MDERAQKDRGRGGGGDGVSGEDTDAVVMRRHSSPSLHGRRREERGAGKSLQGREDRAERKSSQ